MSAPAAAFFDLDRTLVSVASPKIFQRHLSAAGFGTPVDGTLADLAPTVLDLMELPIPAEMSGRSLIVSH